MLKRCYVTFLIKKKITISVIYNYILQKVNNFNDLCFIQWKVEKVAGVKGLEPSTYRVTGDRSNQLSYTPT